VPVVPSWLLEPLREQFSALLPARPVYDPSHPLGCHRPPISDRVISGKLIQVLRFGCSHESIADGTCGATTIGQRRDEWIRAGISARLKEIARDAYDRLIGMKRSLLADGAGIPLGRVLAPASQNDSPLLAPTLGKLADPGPLPEQVTVHLDAGYDSHKTRRELASRSMTGEIAHKGDKAPAQAGQRWHTERTNARHNSFNRLQRCCERSQNVIDAFSDLADTIITIRRLIRQAWTLYR
jgi:transposase